jgi:monoamine oxidase
MADGRLVTMTEARRVPLFDITRSWALPDEPALPADESFAAYLARLGFTPEQLHYTRRSFANATGDDAERFSAAATLLELSDTSNGEGDYRIVEGQITLIEHLAHGLDIRLKTVIQRVRWSESGVTVSTDQGEFHADRAVITLPLGVLQAGKVAFEPPLPAEKQAAIDGLRMGSNIKLVYVLAESPLPRHIAALYSDRNPPMWWTPSFGRQTDHIVWTAFVGGSWARELIALGEQAALQLAFETFRIEVARPDLQYVSAQWVNWVADPFSLGSYSIVPPGGVGLREQLAAPVGRVLFWAGEATAPRAAASTVHGAYTSGKRAAGEILSPVKL